MKKIWAISLLMFSATVFAVDSDGDGVDDSVDAFPGHAEASVDTDNDGEPDRMNEGFGYRQSFEAGTLPSGWTMTGTGWSLKNVPAGTFDGNYHAYGKPTGGFFSATTGYLRFTLATPLSSAGVVVFDGDIYPSSDCVEISFKYGATTVAYSGSGPRQLKTFQYALPAGVTAFEWKVYGLSCSNLFAATIDNVRIYSSGLQEDFDDDNDAVLDVSDKFPLNRAAASDSDNDGFPGSWNASCNAICQAGSGLTLDNCPSTSNPTQANFDGDTQGDACDTDDDNDGVLDSSDAFDFDPSESIDTDGDGTGNNADTDDDNDGMPDVWEIQYGLNPLVNDAGWDADGDNLSNLQEYHNGSNPTIDRTGGDFNGDGIADILWRNEMTKEMRSWTMDGANLYTAISFFPRFSVDNNDWQVAGLGDINADGNADIVFRDVVNGYHRAWMMSATGSDVIRETIVFYPQFGGAEWAIVGLGDANKDGTEDIFFHNSSNGQFRIWEMDNSGNRETVCFFSPQTLGYEAQAVGDLDGDGDADVFWRNSALQSNLIWYVDNCVLAEVVPLPVFGNATTNVVGAGDFEGGNNDFLLALDSANNSQSIWMFGYEDGIGKYIYTSDLPNPIPGDGFVGIADYNGDEMDDILYYNPADGYPRIWWMDNFTRSSHIRTPKFGAGGSWSIINDRDN